MKVEGWLIVTDDSYKAVMIDKTPAANYAARCHSQDLRPLYDLDADEKQALENYHRLPKEAP